MYDDRMVLSMRFPQKLWRIVNTCKSGAIGWNIDGSTILLDYRKFQEEYLDGDKFIFKTRNITSFIRQLNLYGFRKVTSHNRDPLNNSNNPNVYGFLHDYFRAGRADLLSRVCRKAVGRNKYCQQRVGSQKNLTTMVPEIRSPEKENRSVSQLKKCQQALTEALEQIRRECYDKNSSNVPTNENTSSCSLSSSASSSSSLRQELQELELLPMPIRDHSTESDMKIDSAFYSGPLYDSTGNNEPWYIADPHNTLLYIPLDNAQS